MGRAPVRAGARVRAVRSVIVILAALTWLMTTVWIVARSLAA